MIYRHVIPGNLCVGVDANRNFGHHWGDSGGTSNVSCAYDYAGPSAWSEVEVANLRDAVLALEPAPAYYQNMHTAVQMVLYPWGYKCGTEGNEDAQAQDNMATKVLPTT